MIVTQLVKILQKHVPYYTFPGRKLQKKRDCPLNLFLIPLSILNKMNNNIAAKIPNLNK
jgi:hypothetical protein